MAYSFRDKNTVTFFYFVLVFVSLTYLSIGFFINKSNAKILLAGYNTMSRERRECFDIERYLRHFKKFFIRLSIYPLISWLACVYVLRFENALIVWAIGQNLPFVIFLCKHKQTKYLK